MIEEFITLLELKADFQTTATDNTIKTAKIIKATCDDIENDIRSLSTRIENGPVPRQAINSVKRKLKFLKDQVQSKYMECFPSLNYYFDTI